MFSLLHGECDLEVQLNSSGETCVHSNNRLKTEKSIKDRYLTSAAISSSSYFFTQNTKWLYFHTCLSVQGIGEY